MARKRNPTVVTCRVGARMRPRAIRGYSRRVPRDKVVAAGGPFDNWVLSLTTDRRTLSITVRGQAGFYRGSTWVPSLAQQ
jgi:hypothetical protein